MNIKVYSPDGNDITHLFKWTPVDTTPPKVMGPSIHQGPSPLSLAVKDIAWVDLMERYNAERFLYQACVDSGLPPALIERPGNKR